MSYAVSQLDSRWPGRPKLVSTEKQEGRREGEERRQPQTPTKALSSSLEDLKDAKAKNHRVSCHPVDALAWFPVTPWMHRLLAE